MQVREAMTRTPVCCKSNTAILSVARSMVEEDCGAIPVTETGEPDRALGIVTDRDIVTRLVANGKNPSDAKAEDVMTRDLVTIEPDSEVDDAVDRMADQKVRRLVVEENGNCIGLISLADIARATSTHRAGELLQEVSEPTREASKAAV